ncbi:MAG: T9SS type A sorting domain-containing protein [Flammeovirgaceae bacterium]
MKIKFFNLLIANYKTGLNKQFTWTLLFSLLAWFIWVTIPQDEVGIEKFSKIERKKRRGEYFFNMLRDPVTNKIPENIRTKELAFDKAFNDRKAGQRTTSSISYVWSEVGIKDIGGRTRALAYDQNNPTIMLAGGVSGGVFKSTDAGESWTLTSDPSYSQSVTTIVQDTTGGSQTWYYAGGEIEGNSASDRGSTAIFYGSGLFTSTDNGDTWAFNTYRNSGNVLFTRNTTTADTIATGIGNLFNAVNKIAINPTNGDIYVASAAFGIFKSDDDGATFTKTDPMGGVISSCPRYSDVVITDDGDVIISLSNASDICGVSSPAVQGIYRSTNDGTNWTDITPSGFPTSHFRTVLALAPSDNDVLYSFTSTSSTTGYEMFVYDLNGGGSVSSTELTSYIPDYAGSVGTLTQGSYNMILAVKQDDPDFVVFGATNLFRFADVSSLSAAPAQNDTWIGGYSGANDISQYPAHHADQQGFFFHPTNTSTAWSGHDGGISKTTDITATGSQDPVTWETKNLHYNALQYYHINIPADSADNRYMGGNQDTGTPFVVDATLAPTSYTDASSGDGAFSFFGSTRGFVSAQSGQAIRLEYKGASNYLSSDESFTDGDYTLFRPRSNTGRYQFIQAYVVDPNNEEYVYFPSHTANLSSGTFNAELWRHTSIASTSVGDQTIYGTGDGWEEMTAVETTVSAAISNASSISAIEVSTSPADVLYFGASQFQGSAATASPKVYKITNAHTAAVSTVPTDITPATTNWPAGGWIHDIAVNPEDADEVIVVISNYNVVGVFYTSDGGTTWSEIEGDLIGNGSDPGPSIRSAAIHTYNSTTCYLVGTSTGLYGTSTLNGSSTAWTQLGTSEIGNTIVQSLAIRNVDGMVMVGTHGRGAFRGQVSSLLVTPTITGFSSPCGEAGEDLTITGTDFSGVSSVSFNGTDAPIFTVTSATSITVTIPTGATSGTVSVTTPGGTANSSDDFIIVGTTFSGGTWSNGAPTASVNAKIASAYDTDTYGDITCEVLCLEAILTINAAGTVSLSGDLFGGSNLTAETGSTVTLEGVALQTISGSFYNLTINNAAGAALDAASSISGALTLTNGNLASGGNLTLKSSAAETAIVVNTSGSVTGNVTMERYIDAGTTNGYRYFAAPVTGATVNEFSGDVGLSFEGIGVTFSPSNGGEYNLITPFPNVYYYDESLVQSGTVSSGTFTGELKDQAEYGWETPSATSMSMNAGQGFAIRVSSDGVVDIGNGTLNTGNVAVSITNGGQTNSGWNLIGNPYPSPLDWNAIYDDADNTTDVDATVYLFDATAEYTGVNRGYNAASDVGVNGGAKDIAAMQGFFVMATGNHTLNLKNTHRLTSNSGVSFLRTQRDSPEKEGLLRLQLADEDNRTDELVLYFIDGAVDTWDVYDARKFFNSSSDYPLIMSYQADGDHHLMMDCRAPLGNDLVSIPLNILAARTGTHQIKVGELTNFPVNTEIYLEDRVTGLLTDLQNSAGPFITLTKGEEVANRFVVHFRVEGVTSLEDELADRGVSIFAAGQQVHLQFADGPSAISEVRVLDSSGKTLMQFRNSYIQHTFTLPRKGIYIIQVKNNKGLSAKKIYVGQ